MRSSIANYRESLSRIASEISDEDAEESPQLPSAADVSPVSSSGRRRRYSLRTPPPAQVGSPAISNGGTAVYSDSPDEIARYKADIQKLQASEAEIKALSFNYAAMLKEKEEQLSKLREENGSLRKSLESKSSATNALNDNARPLSTSPKSVLGQVQRHTAQENSRFIANNSAKLNASKSDVYGNGVVQLNGVHNVNVKVNRDLLEENNGALNVLRENLESEIKELREQLKNELEKSTDLTQKLEDEYKRNSSLQRELNELKIDKERTENGMRELRGELNRKLSDLRLLQEDIDQVKGKANDVHVDSPSALKSIISTLKKENLRLKLEKDKLEANLKAVTSRNNEEASNTQKTDPNSQKVIDELEKKIEETSKERDKVFEELSRLKQHLLDKELEDSEKMDEDSKTIEDLNANIQQQNSHIMQLERALRHELAKKEEFKKSRDQEIQKSNKIINDLRQKLTNCMSVVESKNVELLNLQTALGQYYAESEAKERLGQDLGMAREEIAKLTEALKIANLGLEESKREKEEIISRVSQTENMLADAKKFIQKLEEDKSRLQLALEKSMTALNRMSLDSDNSVDRRIVIKLLVTYFQRNHSKEVLDLMVRMLGFSEDDKQRIGLAQNTAGNRGGVVRGVLGIPGRLVGGILGGPHHSSSQQPSSDDQSFADLWVDFLLKETEEREKRESSVSTQDQLTNSNLPNNTNNISSSNNINSSNISHTYSEFSTVPLNSSIYSRPPPR